MWPPQVFISAAGAGRPIWALFSDMPPPACEWPWADYTFHPFPVLSSRPTPSRVGRIEFTHTLPPNPRNHDVPWRNLLWAAIVKLTSLYVDAPEFVFAEVLGEQPICAFKTVTAEVQQHSVNWADLSSSLHDLERYHIPVSHARAALSLAGAVNPYPVVVVWDGPTSELVDVDGSALVVEVMTRDEDAGNIVIAFRWNHSMLSPDAARVFANQTLALFDVAVANPSRTANTLGLDAALTSIIEANYDPEEARCATDWLVRNAAERPDAIAHEIYPNLSSPPCLLTYAELNTMANKLAHWLRSNGLELEDRVALCRSRDLQFYVAHAAIFKSGGCYVSVRAFTGSPRHVIHTSPRPDRSRTSRRAKTPHCRRFRRQIYPHKRRVVQVFPGPSVLSRFCKDSGTDRRAGFFGNLSGKIRHTSIPPLHVRLVVSSPFFIPDSDGSYRHNRKTKRMFTQPPWHLLGDQSYVRVPAGCY